MPRPHHAQGRPGTAVIPGDWGRTHSPVATKTMRGTCTATLPGEGPLVYDPTEKVSKREPVDPSYTGPCRVQKLNAQDQTAVNAEQSQTTVGYLITLALTGFGPDDDHPNGADLISTAHVIRITTNPEDPTLVGTYRVSSIVRGTERFERDLFCVEDQSTPTR